VILAAGGGLLAMVVAVVGVRVARLAFPTDTLPFWLRFEIDWRVLAYSLGLAAATACTAGLFPAMRAARQAPAFGLASSSSRSATHSTQRGRLGAVLVAGQVAVSLVLLVAAALLGAALGSMRTQDLGYDPRGLLATDIEPRTARYADGGVRRTYFLSLAEQLRAIPGVEAVSGFDLWGGAPIDVGRENGSPVRRVEAPIYTVMPAYFETLRIRVRAGRALGERDGVGAPPAAVVNETFARRFWPDEQAVGKRVRVTGAADAAQWLTVVGVVNDVRRNPADLEWEPHLYLPASQFPPRRVQLVVRTGSASIPNRALTNAAKAADPDEPLGPILTMDQQIGVWTAPTRFFATSLGGFAAVALLTAIAGVYGVVSGGVTARTREFGIRLALGATPRHIVGIAVRRGARLAGLGAAVGLIGGVGVAQVLIALPFGVERVDPRLVAVAAAALVLVALLAAYGPARRAGRLQPTVALGDDA
jgi:predicted permease